METIEVLCAQIQIYNYKNSWRVYKNNTLHLVSIDKHHAYNYAAQLILGEIE